MKKINKKTILLVEDETVTAMAEKRGLEKLNYNVLTAHSGEEAINSFNSIKIDLLLMDIDLGTGIDGIETAEAILKANYIPIVFLSSHTEPDIVKKTEKITSYGYVVKNSDLTVLDASIKMAFKLFDEKINERVKEAGLKESEEKYRLLFETTISGFALLEMMYDNKNRPIDCRYIDVNPAHEKLTGLKSKDIIGKTATECIPDLEDSWIENYARVDKTGNPMTIENYVDGLKRWYKGYAYRPKPGYVAVTFENITERKLAEEALVLSDNIVNNIQIGLHIYKLENIDDDNTLRMIFANKAALGLTGIPADDIIGKTLDENFPGLREQGIPQIYAEVVRTGKPKVLEDIYYKDDRIVEGAFSVKAFPLPDNKLGVSFENITERKLTEEALRENEEKYRLLYESITDSVFILNREFRYTMINKHTEKIIKIPRKKLLGNKITDIFKGIESTIFFKTYKDVMESRKEDTVINNFTHRDGRKGWYEVRVYPVPEGILCIARDITNRKKVEKALEKSHEDNKNLLKELQHRAKNSFSMISSMIVLSAETCNSPDTKNVLSEISSRVKAVSEMYDLLYISDSVTEVRLDEYFNRVASSLPNNSKNITIIKSCEAITVPVKTAIPTGIIIAELITNSIKHAFTNNSKGTVNLLLKKTGSGATIEVEDDGIGLPSGFDISNVDSLGLKLVHILTIQIEGSFKIKEGNGTRCIIEFPIYEN